jgi:hypothetical protein
VGAWGVGALDNDSALDIEYLWKRFKIAGYSDSEYTAEGTLNYFIRQGLGKTLDWGNADTTARLIALAELFHRDGLPIRGEVLEYFEAAILLELKPATFREWSEPDARKHALEELLARIGGRRRRLKQSKLFRHPAIEFASEKELAEKLERWITGIRSHKLSAFPRDEEYPRFWQVLDRIMKSQVVGLEENAYPEAVKQRFMLLAAYLGIYGILPEDEAIELVRKVRGKWAHIGNATDIWKQFIVNIPPSSGDSKPSS